MSITALPDAVERFYTSEHEPVGTLGTEITEEDLKRAMRRWMLLSPNPPHD